MELLLIGSLLGSPLAGVGMWVVAALISLALVIPKVNRLGQPILPWALCCVGLPLVAYGVVTYRTD